MTPEQLVPTLETCKALKEAGWKKETALIWVVDGIANDIKDVVIRPDYDRWRPEQVFSAPTLQELLEELSSKNFLPELSYHGGCVYVSILDQSFSVPIMTDTIEQPKGKEAEAAALLWLELNTKEAPLELQEYDIIHNAEGR